MHTTPMTPAEIQSRGFAALARELGPVDYVRFLQQIMPGSGDYSKERHQWLDDLGADEIREGITQLQRARKSKTKKRVGRKDAKR